MHGRSSVFPDPLFSANGSERYVMQQQIKQGAITRPGVMQVSSDNKCPQIFIQESFTCVRRRFPFVQTLNAFKVVTVAASSIRLFAKGCLLADKPLRRSALIKG